MMQQRLVLMEAGALPSTSGAVDGNLKKLTNSGCGVWRDWRARPHISPHNSWAKFAPTRG